MTLDQFEARLIQLLREALAAGHSTDDIAAIVEHVIEQPWKVEE